MRNSLARKGVAFLWITALCFMPQGPVLSQNLSVGEEQNPPASQQASAESQKPAQAQNERERRPLPAPVAAQPVQETAPAAPPQPAPPKTPLVILDVVVQGNRIVSTNTILSKMRSQKGGELAQSMINEDIKRLYATGFFQDIRMDVEEQRGGYRLIVHVDEKPIVRKITIEGFSVFKEDKLRKEIKLIEGQILDRRAVKEGEEAIRKLYAEKGYRFVDVRSEIETDSDKKEATVHYYIAEGEEYRIKEISFEDNEAFSDKELKKLMKTKRKKLFSKGIFKEETFRKDLERIRLFYQQEGFLDVKVVADFEYNKEEQWIYITIVIEEGTRYVTGLVNIKGNDVFPESEIWQVMEMLPGLTYSQFYLFKDIERIRDFYYENGYMDARVIPDIRLNRETGKVDVTYEIQEGDLFFVEQVKVRGNTKTKDIVIRRELRIRPGDRFDGDQIKKSEQRLENLAYFEEVTYDTEPVSGQPNRKNIIFRVKEKRTGELSFGGGVSSVDTFVGFAEISQRNFDLTNWPRFTGGGQSISLRARVGTISQDYSLSFVEPYLFNKPVSLGLDLFNIRRDDRNVDFEQERLGAGFTLSRLFKDVLRLGFGYTLERVELDEISADAPSIVRDFAGTNWLSRIRQFGSYDTRDSPFNPSKGMVVEYSADFVGSFLGGDQDFYVLNLGFTKFWSLFKKHLLEFKIRLGTADAFGDSDTVPVFDRFFAGGLGTVRGYNYRRVGPIEAGDAVGGESLAVVNLEYTFPVPYLEAFRGAVFIDAGHVNEDSYKIDIGDVAISVGPGIKVKTPIGPIAFYYGLPIANRDTEDENGRFEFSLSRGF